jgi:hypothetical protein
VIRRLQTASRIADFEYENGRGPRDLNPGPHGPEPCRRRVLECPGGFSGGRLNSNGVAFMSFCDLSEPSVSGNA